MSRALRTSAALVVAATAADAFTGGSSFIAPTPGGDPACIGMSCMQGGAQVALLVSVMPAARGLHAEDGRCAHSLCVDRSFARILHEF